MDKKDKTTIGICATLALGAMLLFGPISDPALPEVVYGSDGKPYTQDGERIEEDSPLWECTRDDNRAHCED